jgi:ABC-2 type transport system ATP-binding protein
MNVGTNININTSLASSPVTTGYAIETRGLTKIYGHGNHKVTVVDSLSFSVPQGIVFGYLGPNGAGKTTTIRMLTGVLEATSGEATIAGVSLKHPDRVKERIGYANQSASVYGDLTVEENLRFKAGLFLHPRAIASAVSRVIEQLGLERFQKMQAGTLSGGWKQRLSIGTAIIHQPSVLFLDEPTAGLDPVGRRALWDTIYNLSGEGTTVFVTTHYMDEAERCQQLAMISRGKVLAQGTPEQLKSSVDGQFFELEPQDLGLTLRQVKNLTGVRDAWISGSSLRVATLPEFSPTALEDFTGPSNPIRRVSATLEDTFVFLAGKV